MGFGQFLQQQGLSPDVNAKLQTIYDTPDGNPDPMGAPTPEEMQQYGATPQQAAIAEAANSAAPGQSPASPTLQKDWTPETDVKRTEAAQEAAAAGPAAPEEAPVQAAPASPGHYAPAHWQPGTRSEAIRYGMDPEKLAPAQTSRDAATGHALEANRLREDAANQQARADFAYSQEHERLAADAARQAKLQQDQKEQYIQQEQGKLNDLSIKAQQQVDPEAAKGSAGAQLMAAIGIALGQYGASINGGTNTAMQIVQNNIDRNIKAQEANIANAGKAHDREQSLYRQNLEAFGDRERATLATKMQLLEQARAIADQQYAVAKSSLNEADKHAWDAETMKQQGAWQQEFAQLTDDKHESQSNEHYVPGQMVGGAAGKPLGNLVTLSDGTTVQMPNEKQQDSAIAKIQIVDNLQRMNNRALQIRQKLYDLNPVLDRTAYKAGQAELEDMEEKKAALLSSEAGQGVLRDKEYVRAVAKQGFYTQGIGLTHMLDPLAGSDRKVADQNLRAQIKRGDDDQRAFVKAAGGHIVKRGYAADATGQLAPSAKYTGQDVQPTEQLAPHGAVPMKKGESIPTADRPLGATTPRAENFGEQPRPPMTAKHKKDEKKK